MLKKDDPAGSHQTLRPLGFNFFCVCFSEQTTPQVERSQWLGGLNAGIKIGLSCHEEAKPL